jgi:imidazolonepropionase-like amidohydrolase
MAQAGVRLVAGTDAGVRFTPFDGLVTTLESMVGFGEMSALEALVSATSLAAQSLGLGDTVGALAPGLRADLVVVEESPLADLRVLRDVKTVVIGGEVVARDGQVLD